MYVRVWRERDHLCVCVFREREMCVRENAVLVYACVCVHVRVLFEGHAHVMVACDSNKVVSMSVYDFFPSSFLFSVCVLLHVQCLCQVTTDTHTQWDFPSDFIPASGIYISQFLCL